MWRLRGQGITVFRIFKGCSRNQGISSQANFFIGIHIGNNSPDIHLEAGCGIGLPMKDIWGVLMRKDSPLAEKEAISAEDLWDKPLILSHQTSINSEMFSWLKADRTKLNIVATYDLLYNASLFVEKGGGYVIALDKLINTTGESNLCFKPFSPALEAGPCIIWKKYQVFSRAFNESLLQLQREIENSFR